MFCEDEDTPFTWSARGTPQYKKGTKKYKPFLSKREHATRNKRRGLQQEAPSDDDDSFMMENGFYFEETVIWVDGVPRYDDGWPLSF